MMRTYVYIDGFNLYYGALKGTSHKWLDVKALFRSILRPENDILKIKYYTARVSARPDNPDAPTRQDFYLQALAAHIPELEITEGHFIQKPVTMRLMNKMRFRRSMYVRVLKSEEKGSDVNLSVHLVNDAWNNCYDCAVVCSNDGDMAEAMRIVKRERRKSVVLVVPGDPAVRPATCHLPNPIPGTSIRKPPNW
jgi:uncharacterized LabA/DUF88 family protein